MISAGKRNTRVTIQEPTPTADSVGQRIPSWTTRASRWGQLIQRDGRETEGASVLSITTWTLSIYYDSTLSAMGPEWRVLADGRTFDVQAVINVDQKNRELTLLLTEVV